MSELPTLAVRIPAPKDYAQYTRWFAELGVDHGLPSEERWVSERRPNTLFFEEEGRPVAYAYFEVLADTGYVRNMVVDPTARGRGVARAVMLELKRRFEAAHCSEWCLNVRRDNHAAIRVYEAIGLRPAFEARSFRIAWPRVSELAPADPSWTIRFPDADEDAGLERRFGLDRGLVTARRERSTVRVLTVRDPSLPDPLGLACYDFEFGGASPFVATNAAVVRALLEAMRAIAAERDQAMIVIQDDPSLWLALDRAGASLVLDIIHYRATL